MPIIQSPTIQQLLTSAIREGDISSIRFLLAHGASVTQMDEDGWTPMHIAAEAENIWVLEELRSAGGDVNHAEEYEENTPAHYAALAGNIEVLIWLEFYGANINQANIYGVIPITTNNWTNNLYYKYSS